MPDGSISAAALAGGEVRLRPARPGDLDELVRIETAAFAGDRIARRRMRALAASGETARIVVADRGDRLAGYALVLLRRRSRIGRLYSLATDPDEAGRGLGGVLLAAAERAAAEAGALVLRLEVREDNLPAIRLYRRSGYGEIGRRHSYYADGMDALRFERRLDSAGALSTPRTRAAASAAAG